MPRGVTTAAKTPGKSRLVGKLYFSFAVVVVTAWVTTTLVQLGLMRTAVAQAHLGGLEDLPVVVARVAFAGLVLVLAGGFVIARRLASPLAELIRVANAMRSGRYDERVAPTDYVDLSSLGETLNVLGEEVSSRIAAMSRDRAQLRSMLSAMDEGIIAIDGAGRILFSNQAASRLLRSDLRLSRGEPLDSIPVLRMFEGVVQEAKSTGQLVNLEVKLGPPENQTYLSTKAQPFGLVGGTITQQKSQVFAAAAGALSGVVVVLHNMTNVRRLERVRRDFVANVSHELKTPLTAIKGYVEMLLGGAAADPDTSRRFLSKIDANVNRLSDLVHDILSLARIETHDEFGGVPEGARVDWRSVIQAVAAAHEDAAVSKGITLAVNLPQGPMVVTGDRESLRQILDNLAGNAIKYTQAGGKVWIEGRVSGEGAICEVSVRDSGIGIPEKHLDRIFERFYRVDKARSRELGGTGLGLSIVKNLVASLGGEIRVESNPGEGSTFTVRMKMSPRQQEESQ